ncbi:MAG: GNAT family N-acetyltransferase [Rhodospirillaceae bacterium]|nr:GNAT family N-acetyltransferase [Rhodospirillales bacterium]
MEMHVEEIRPQTCPELAAELAAAGLPVDDLILPGRRFFRFWDNHAEPIGFVGMEALSPDAALLRSLVVVPNHRKRGLARPMTVWLLGRLRGEGVTEAWVLTTTIADFAMRLGFARVERGDAPACIRATRQFRDLCPASAVLLRKSL